MKQTIQYFQLFCYIAGLDALTNKIPGYYYGISKQWKMEEKRAMGIYFLKKAFHIFDKKGEKQMYLEDIE